MKKIYFLLFLSALTISNLASAGNKGDVYVQAITVGYHWEKETTRASMGGDNMNFGVGAGYYFIDGVAIGVKVNNNSMGRTAKSLVATFDVWSMENWSIHLTPQISTGYQTSRWNHETKSMVFGQLCRRFDGTKFSACMSTFLWQQGTYDKAAYTGLNFKYTF